MKRTLVLSLMLLLSGCACFDGMCGDDEDTAPVTTTKNIYRGYDDNGCDYYNQGNCEKRIQNPKIYNQPQDYNRRTNVYVYETPEPRKVIYQQAEPETVYIKQVRPTPAPIIVEAPKPAPIMVPSTTTVNKTVASCGDIKTTINESSLPDSSSPCPAQIKEVREPVEIVYKKTTYKTIYEPKTTSSVSYEKEPYKQVQEEVIVKTQTAPTMVETITTTTTTSDSLDVLPADEIK